MKWLFLVIALVGCASARPPYKVDYVGDLWVPLGPHFRSQQMAYWNAIDWSALDGVPIQIGEYDYFPTNMGGTVYIRGIDIPYRTWEWTTLKEGK